MTTFALVHGAWGTGWHWGQVVGELERMGHRVVTPDLPCEDPAATFDDYAEVVLDALADADDDVVVVGFSLGGNTAPLVAARRPVRRLVYVAAIVPEPGVSLRDQVRRGDPMFLPDYLTGVDGPDEDGVTRWVDFDVYLATTHHDCEPEIVRERFARSRGQSNRPNRVPCSLMAHPALPTRYVMCSEDRLMDNGFWREAVPRRLNVEPIELPGGHSPMVSRPAELALLLAAP